MRPSRNVTVEPAFRPAGGRTRMRRLSMSLVAALAVMGLLSLTVTACRDGIRGAGAPMVSSLNLPTLRVTSSRGSATHEAAVIVKALNAIGLALCHSDYDDFAAYDIYGLFGAYSTRRYFPHHSAVPIRMNGTDSLSCLTQSEPNTGAIEIDMYASAAEASAALREVGHIWFAAWLYGNVAVVVDQTTSHLVAQQVSRALDHLRGTLRVG